MASVVFPAVAIAASIGARGLTVGAERLLRLDAQ